MSVSLITFANVGKKQNLKTPDILPIIDTFASHHEALRVVCLLHKDFYFWPTVSAIPSPVWYLLRVYEKVSRHQLSRQTLEKIFDFFAQFKLGKAKVAIFHGGYFLPRTLARAHRKGLVTVDLTVTAHIGLNARLEQEELRKLGVAGHDGLFTRLSKTSAHLHEFDYVIAMSDFVKRSYVEAGYSADRIFVAHPDIDIQRFAAPAMPKGNIFRVLYVADTQPLKGLHYLFEAWKHLSLPNTELWILGSLRGPESLVERYRQFITSHPNVRYFPHDPHPEKFYREASVFVLPSLTEGFGRVAIEAMASGLPVITTENAQGLVEDGESGFVVPIRDSEAIREKIELLYHNPEMRERMGLVARKAVEDKKPFGDTVFDIYQEILKREHLQ